MADGDQAELLSPLSDVRLLQLLLADLHDDLAGKVARFRQLNDLSAALGLYGTMLPGGETALAVWTEARTSFVHGNYVATVMPCQSLAEQVLAAHLSLGWQGQEVRKRISFAETLERCIEQDLVPDENAKELRRLAEFRNPLSHFRGVDDPSNLSRRVLDSTERAERHLFNDASFAIGVAIRLLALPAFRIDG
ncbi:hypothetical protein [Bradyrhizobium sp.]|uniref:hypothetical protein n=1 Tax=Bradyrhizobium sp. TaxID=376 RepID=UPI0023A4CE5E|nr:hypothetical protein [Bradyrhizobium sp.]MDE2380520.1 hypothetical protein [Bradyrhizobium sp.]